MKGLPCTCLPLRIPDDRTEAEQMDPGKSPPFYPVRRCQGRAFGSRDQLGKRRGTRVPRPQAGLEERQVAGGQTLAVSPHRFELPSFVQLGEPEDHRELGEP